MHSRPRVPQMPRPWDRNKFGLFEEQCSQHCMEGWQGDLVGDEQGEIEEPDQRRPSLPGKEPTFI